MSLGTDEGQENVNVPKIIIVSATKLCTVLGVDSCECLNLSNVS